MKKKKMIKMMGGYQKRDSCYFGQFFKWLWLKRRGFVKWKNWGKENGES